MSKNTIEIYNVGTKVKLEDDVFGTIIGVNIGPNHSVSYDCGWWNSRSYSKETFSPEQIEALVTTEKTKIGFRT